MVDKRIDELPAITAASADLIPLWDSSGSATGRATAAQVVAAGATAASDSAAGIVELATQAEVNAGSATGLAVTPATLANYTSRGRYVTNVSHVSSSPLDMPRVGVDQTLMVTLSGNATSIVNSNMVDGDIRQFFFTATGSTRTVDLSSWSDASGALGTINVTTTGVTEATVQKQGSNYWAVVKVWAT